MDAFPIYRVSTSYLRNLWQQAISCAVGVLFGWLLFLLGSLWILPGLPVEELCRLPIRFFTDSKLWLMPSPDEVRDLTRLGVGPALAVCVLLGSLVDWSTWCVIQYEIRPEKLVMRWRRFRLEVSWELIQIVDERPHSIVSHRSLRIVQHGASPILVRGLDDMPGFIEVVRSRLPRLAKWKISPIRLDPTSRLTNFVFGFLLQFILTISWMAYYVFKIQSIDLVWSWILLFAGCWIWFWRPLSRPHLCVREAEVFLVAAMLLLSALITGLNWLGTPFPLSARFTSWLGW